MKKYFDSILEVVLWYVGFLVLVTCAFSLAESIPIDKAFYWAYISATSTGYGDITPKTVLGMIITFVTVHGGIFFFAPMIVIRLVDKLNHDHHEFTDNEQRELLASVKEILAEVKEGK